MLKIYITRHGQDEDNAAGILNGRRDKPLTKIGESQALELAKNVKQYNLNFDAVYTSPLLRVRQTAQIVVDNTGNPQPIVKKDLIERDFGVMTGELVSSIAEKCAPHILQVGTIIYFLNVDGAETFPNLLARAHKILTEIKSRHISGSVLLATHGDFGKMIYAAFYGLSWEQILKQFHFGNAELLFLSEQSPAEDTHVFQFRQYNV